MKKNRFVIIGIICIIITIIAYYFRDLKIKDIDKERYDISKLLEINDNKNKDAYINIYVIPLMIAEYPNDNNAFYVVYNNNYYSILYMNKKEASKITKDMVDNGYRINGTTKEKPIGIEKYGLDFLEKLFDSHEDDDGHNHEINDNSYEEYFGDIYLDATVSRYNGTTIFNLIIWMFGIIGGLCLLSSTYKYIC